MVNAGGNNGHILAYIGDAVMTLKVREFLVSQGWTKSQDLQQRAAAFISAKGQAQVVAAMLESDFLSGEEIAIYHWGRNYKGNSKAKNVTVQTYKMASGFEALWGYYYLSGNAERLEQIWNKTRIIVERDL